MRVLGIDPGSHRTGWGVVEPGPGRLVHVASGVLEPGGELMARLCGIAAGLESVLAEYRPKAVAVESLFHHQNSQTALKLGQARGVVLLCIARAGAPLFEYAPAEVKRAAAGNGRAGKDQVQRMVKMILGLHEPRPFDASDALALAICHVQLGGTLRLSRLTGAQP